jgi:hypothetical protein
MSPSTADCTKTAPCAEEKTCLPCDIPASCRNSYYRGKLLTERDFTDEQRYGMDKMRLHMQKLHGWGVVCGLLAKRHPHCPEKRLVVGEGFAIDDCGREIRLLADDYVVLPQPLAGAPPPMKGKSEAYAGKKSGIATDAEDQHSNEDGDRDEEGAPADDGCNESPAPRDLYLCIRYSECETEFAPAPFDDCSCTTSSQKPNRVCESYRLELSEQKPDCWDQATHAPCEAGDCRQYYHEARECCAETNCIPCVPLAVIHDFVPGEAIREEQIDNWSARRQLASTETLDRVIRCILTKLPTEELTRIEDTNWEHNRRMLCREFMEEYVGTPEHPRGFRIEFSHKVHSGHIDTRSYQALVVFRPDNDSEPRHLQVAPARVEHERDETGWARLHIDHAYARRHLEGKNFDLFLTLKCDVIRDPQGHSVDGDFLGRLPTGDNIQGGTFESWVRVRARSRED